jgi:uncharacterized membrane protein
VPLALVALGIAIAAMWLPWVTSSFWLDETGTWWVVKDGLGDVIERSQIQGQTPAYYVVAWLARHAFGSSEVALRIPSMIGALVALAGLYRLGTLLLGRDAAAWSLPLFASLQAVAFVAIDARPYALALATLIWSTVVYLRWLEEGRFRFGVSFGMLAAATVALSYTFALAYIAHILVALGASRRWAPPRATRMVFPAVVAAALVAPAVPHLISLLTQADLLTWRGGVPHGHQLAQTLVPLPIVGGVLIGSLVALSQRGSLVGKPDATPASTRRFLLAWILIPAATLFILGLALSGKFYQQRYVLSVAPAVAVAAAWAMTMVRSARARAVSAIATIVIAASIFQGSTHRTQDWRSAVATINAEIDDPRVPVLFASGFSTGNVLTGQRAELVRAPVLRYPVRGRIVQLPATFDAGGLARMETIVRSVVFQDQVFALIGFETADYVKFLTRTLDEHGFDTRTLLENKGIHVLVFDRAP